MIVSPRREITTLPQQTYPLAERHHRRGTYRATRIFRDQRTHHGYSDQDYERYAQSGGCSIGRTELRSQKGTYGGAPAKDARAGRRQAMDDQILVVEDDERLAAVLRDGLAHHGYAVTVSATGAGALAAVHGRPPALVILDLMLPDLDGVEVCRRLRATNGPPVIMLTARDAIADKVHGLESGADDYLTKPFVLEELVARVRAVLRRHAPRSPTPLRVADLTLDPRGRQVWRGARPVELTGREFDLLECLMRHAGQVLTTGTLLERVWGYTFEVESNVVKVYVAYLRHKLNAASEPDLIHAVRGVGYVLRAPRTPYAS